VWKLYLIVGTSLANVMIPSVLIGLTVADALSGDAEYPPLRASALRFGVIGVVILLIAVLTILLVRQKPWAGLGLAVIDLGLALFIGITLWQTYQPMFYPSPNMFLP